MELVNNTKYEILTAEGFKPFTRLSRTTTKMQRLLIDGREVYASKNHIFYVNGEEVRVADLPKRCWIDGEDRKVKFRKTLKFKTEYAYDVVGVETEDSHYLINGGVRTHNCDEFAFVRDSIQDEFWTSIAPTLATGGDCIIASTPNGDSNLFAQMWRGAQTKSNGFVPIHVKWDEPPGRDSKFKAAEIGKIGEIRWRQEYECEFISSDPLLFDAIALANLTKKIDKIEPVGELHDVVFYEKLQRGATYIVGVDPATGSGSDFTVFQVFSFPALEQVAEWRSNTMSSVSAYRQLTRMLRMLEQAGCDAYFSVENNGVGEALLALYEADEEPPEEAILMSEEGKARLGMNTSGKSKIQACLMFKDLVERGMITIRSQQLLDEMKLFVRTGNSYAAKTGATDDCISAVLIVLRVLGEMSTYEQEAHNKLYGQAYVPYDDDFDDDDYGAEMVF